MLKDVLERVSVWLKWSWWLPKRTDDWIWTLGRLLYESSQLNPSGRSLHFPLFSIGEKEERRSRHYTAFYPIRPASIEKYLPRTVKKVNPMKIYIYIYSLHRQSISFLTSPFTPYMICKYLPIFWTYFITNWLFLKYKKHYETGGHLKKIWAGNCSRSLRNSRTDMNCCISIVSHSLLLLLS